MKQLMSQFSKEAYCTKYNKHAAYILHLEKQKTATLTFIYYSFEYIYTLMRIRS